MKLTLSKKLGLSFGVILILMTMSAVVTYTLVLKNEKIYEQILDLRIGTVLIGKDVINGINHSLAALRGYMILGKDPEKAEKMNISRQTAWKNIENSISGFDKMALIWTVPANINRLKEIKKELVFFKLAQQEIKDISDTEDNIPSYKLLLDEAAPRASQMLSYITAIINEEATLDATKDRKNLLKNLADIRGSFAIGLANIRAFLLSGDIIFKSKFEAQWQVNVARVNTVNENQASLFTESQRSNWNDFIRIRNDFSELPEKMFQLRSASDWNQANHWLGTKAAPSAAKILQLLGEMNKSQETSLNNDIVAAKSTVQSLKTTLIIITLISLIIGIACAMIFSRDLLNRLYTILSRASDIASGDMTGKALLIKGKDELTDLMVSINKMSESLQSFVHLTANAMVDASKGVSQISGANNQMSNNVLTQRAQVDQISAAIEELSYSSVEVSSNCNDAAESSTQALKLANTGGEIVQESLSQMVSIKQAFDNSNSAITSLSAQSKQIGDILSVIKGIADQTNLLALNAAIEAARAGEQGRGFAVVADEVRQLAGRTTEATIEVATAIEAMQQETDNAVSLMTEGTQLVDCGVEMSNEAASSLSDIISSIGDVSGKVQAIAATAEEQTMVSAEIAKNTESVLNITQNIEVGLNDVLTLSARVGNDTNNKSNELLTMI
ncbi:MAG: methyl-accepting chemotaxis protein [Psychroserpens sp.]|jgi:methyl-accepting chemotaxis protein